MEIPGCRYRSASSPSGEERRITADQRDAGPTFKFRFKTFDFRKRLAICERGLPRIAHENHRQASTVSPFPFREERRIAAIT